MICKNCGNTLKDDAAFCTNCGAKADGVQNPENNAENPNQNQNQNYSGQSPNQGPNYGPNQDPNYGYAPQDRNMRMEQFFNQMKNLTKTPQDKWCRFLESVIKIFLVLEILGSLGGGIAVCAGTIGGGWGSPDAGEILLGLGAGLLTAVVGIFFAFLSTSLIMIFVNMAKDLSAIRKQMY